MMATDRSYEVKEVGIFRPSQPKMLLQPKLGPGDVGYVIANMKTSSEVKVGDTLTWQDAVRVTVLDASRRRVNRVRLERVRKESLEMA